MGKTDTEKGPENLFPGERVAQGWATLDKQAGQGGETLLEGESAKVQNQIRPKTE